MEVKVDADRFGAECEKALGDFRDLTSEGMTKAVDATAKEAVRVTKARSRSRTGRYRKNWTHKVTDKKYASYARTVYNSKRYQLTHLLEKGHAIEGYMKYRTSKRRTRAFPHIMTEEEAEKILQANLEKEMTGP